MSIESTKLFESKSWLIEKYFADSSHPLINTVRKLILVSDYACKQVVLLKELLMGDECLAPLSRHDYFQALENISLTLPQAHYARIVRQYRHTHFLRLLLLELSRTITTEQVIRSWSDCADALILHGLDYCQYHLSLRHGVPRDKHGNKAILFTVGMGKLGGRELNYSSDIDLIFTYTADGKTDGEESIENQYYFSKVVRQFSQLFHSITPDGFIFRVDLRLRPNGDSGTLVSSLTAIETYYQEQGRDWERYAMVKARVISASIHDVPSWFKRLIIPFVYRRYVDFSVIESLRSMKAMIEREVQLNPCLDDIKRGKGGIREVEFVIQSFQLIRGGRLPHLQAQSALEVLDVLKKERLLHHSDALKQAYLFLRQLENILQSQNDQQTHLLPKDPIKQVQIILAMGYVSWDELLNKLHQYQRIINYAFHAVMGKVDYYEDENRLLVNQLTTLWQGHVETSMAVNLLTSLGFENAKHCYQMIHAFRHGPRCRRLSQGARIRLDRFMVLLMTELIHVKNTDKVLLHVMHLLENIVGRSAYLALLTENPPVLTELLFWFAHSPFITSLLVNQPFLLEVLLDQGQEWQPLPRYHLERLLHEKLKHYHEIEVKEELLRQFKLTNWLVAARAELYGLCSAVRVGRFLADVAQVIVTQVLVLAREQLCLRYPEMKQIHLHFAVIAYGKLGSREMNYASDLDLVFLHTVKPEHEGLVTRLTQKILHMLTTRLQSGILYAVDTRLRPSGSAGLLVSHVDSFIEYQKTQAWTWEHQALLKARVLTGSSAMKRDFLQLKKEVLSCQRDRAMLQKEILMMRAKMEQHHETQPLKHMPGGLLDLEFLVQFLVLNLRNPKLACFTQTLSQLKRVYDAGILSKEQFLVLKKAYCYYHHLLHLDLLSPGTTIEENTPSQVLIIYHQHLSYLTNH